MNFTIQGAANSVKNLLSQAQESAANSVKNLLSQAQERAAQKLVILLSLAAEAYVYSMAGTAFFWSTRDIEPVHHVASVAGATKTIKVSIALVLYCLTERMLAIATDYRRSVSPNSNLPLLTVKFTIIKTAAISAATFSLSGELTTSTFFATALLTEAFNNVETSTVLYILRLRVRAGMMHMLNDQPNNFNND